MSTYPPAPPTICRYCEGTVIYTSNSHIYNGREYGDWPYVYVCTSCRASVGVHPNTETPLGTLANVELKTARRMAKAAFLRRTKELQLSRKKSYKYLQETMGMAKDQAHFGMFEVEDCIKALNILTNRE